MALRGGLINQRHLTQNGTSVGAFNDGFSHHHFERSLQHDEHGIAGFTCFEQDIAGREPHRICFVRE